MTEENNPIEIITPEFLSFFELNIIIEEKIVISKK